MSTHSSGRPKDPRASDVNRKRVDWLWRNRFPLGMISLIAGRPDYGKSLAACLIAAEISKTDNVIFSNREDPVQQVIRPRLEAVGARLNRITFYSPTLPDDLEGLEARVKALKAKAVFLDPVAAHLRPSMYNDQDVRTALSPVAEMLARLDCAMIMVTHTVKYVSSRAHILTAIGGSGGGLTGAARAIYLFGADPGDPSQRAMVPIKFNLGPKPLSITFEIDEIEFTDKDDKLETVAGRLIVVSDSEKINPHLVMAQGGEGVQTKGAEKREAAAEWLTNYLALGPRPANELKEDAIQHGVSWGTIRRAAEDVEIEKSRVGGSHGHSMWALPIGHPALVDDDDAPDGTLEALLGDGDES